MYNVVNGCSHKILYLDPDRFTVIKKITNFLNSKALNNYPGDFLIEIIK